METRIRPRTLRPDARTGFHVSPSWLIGRRTSVSLLLTVVRGWQGSGIDHDQTDLRREVRRRLGRNLWLERYGEFREPSRPTHRSTRSRHFLNHSGYKALYRWSAACRRLRIPPHSLPLSGVRETAPGKRSVPAGSARYRPARDRSPGAKRVGSGEGCTGPEPPVRFEIDATAHDRTDAIAFADSPALRYG